VLRNFLPWQQVGRLILHFVPIFLHRRVVIQYCALRFQQVYIEVAMRFLDVFPILALIEVRHQLLRHLVQECIASHHHDNGGEQYDTFYSGHTLLQRLLPEHRLYHDENLLFCIAVCARRLDVVKFFVRSYFSRQS
tara:strand:+ start:430 stop:837 length:408 start_codon:yes stop_codon:yes gene_type:complete